MSFMNQDSLVIAEYSLIESIFFLVVKVVPNSSSKPLPLELNNWLNF